MNCMKIGEKIRAIRLLKGLSQENMADLINIKVLAYGDIERGKTDIRFSRLEQISSVLEVSICDIIDFNLDLKALGLSQNTTTEIALLHKLSKLELENQLLKEALVEAKGSQRK